MTSLSYRGHRFPASIIQHAIWLYLRFTLSYRDVEELLAERGLDLSYETIRRWVLKFGPVLARGLRQRRRLCHVADPRVGRSRRWASVQAPATAARHCAIASALKVRRVDREMRWRCR